MVRKIFTAISVVILCFALTGCASKSESDSETSPIVSSSTDASATTSATDTADEGTWKTIEANGYSYEVDKNWSLGTEEIPFPVIYFLGPEDTESVGLRIFETDYTSSHIYQDTSTFSLQEEIIRNSFKAESTESDLDTIETTFENIVFDKIGDFPRGTGTIYMSVNGEPSLVVKTLVFFVSPEVEIRFNFSCPPDDLEKYEQAIDHVYNSVKLL